MHGSICENRDEGLRRCTEDRDQDHPQEKEIQKSKMAD